MRIAGYVNPLLSVSLARAVDVKDEFLSTASWEQLTRTIEKGRISLAVIDPGAAGRSDVRVILKLAQDFPHVPFLIYTCAGTSSPGVIIALSKASINHVLLHPFEGTIAEMRREFTACCRDTLCSRFQERLSSKTQRLSGDLQHALSRMFAKPELFASASDLALCTGLSTLTMYRQINAVGLPSPKGLLVAARLLRFFALTNYAQLDSLEAAKRVGCSNLRSIGRYSEKMLAVNLSRVSLIDERIFVERLLDGLASFEHPPRKIRIKPNLILGIGELGYRDYLQHSCGDGEFP
jgi:hypothetical protein